MRNTMLSMAILLSLLCASGLQSCDDKTKGLIDTKWTLDKITTQYGQVLIPSNYYTVLIKEASLHLKLDVNACQVTYSVVDKNTIQINDSGAACTKACCDTDLATNFVQMLSGELLIELDGDKLSLIGQDTFSFHRWTEKDVKQELDKEYLTIRRTGCFGTCPIYEMTLFNNGSANFTGRRFVNIKGKATHSFDAAKMTGLMARAKQLDFASLQKVFDNPQISDMESVFIEYGGITIKVRYRMDAPKELLELIQDVHQVAVDAGWVKA